MYIPKHCHCVDAKLGRHDSNCSAAFLLKIRGELLDLADAIELHKPELDLIVGNLYRIIHKMEEED